MDKQLEQNLAQLFDQVKRLVDQHDSVSINALHASQRAACRGLRGKSSMYITIYLLYLADYLTWNMASEHAKRIQAKDVRHALDCPECQTSIALQFLGVREHAASCPPIYRRKPIPQSIAFALLLPARARAKRASLKSWYLIAMHELHYQLGPFATFIDKWIIDPLSIISNKWKARRKK